MSFPPPTPKQARTLWTALTALSVAIFVALLVLLVWALGQVLRILSPVLWPLAIGGILAYLLDPVVDFLERRNVPRGRAILLVFFCVVVLVGGFFASVVPRVVHETADLIADVPAYSRQIQTNVTQWIAKSPWGTKKTATAVSTNAPAGTNVTLITPLSSPALTNAPSATPAPSEADWVKNATAAAISWLTRSLPAVGSWFLDQLSRMASWAGMIIALALVPVFTYYFLQEKKGIQAGWTNYLPVHESRFKQELVFVINAINNYLIVFFRGQVVVALCIGVLLTIGFLSIGLNYAVLIGLAAGLLNIVPYLGAILTIVPAVTLAAVQFRDWLHPVLVVAIFCTVQMLEGFVISPKIMGDRVGLHPVTIIIAVLVGTTLLGGILGGILAIPLTAALRVLMFRYVWKKREDGMTNP
jgi:predicted PurR-regulated permease PerM